MKRPKIQHVIFDWSGTLFDDHKVSFVATQETVKFIGGGKLTYEDYKKHFVIPVDKFYRRFNKTISIDVVDKFYFECFEKIIEQGELFDGVKQTLRDLQKAGVTMSIFSTVRQDLLERLCKKLGLTSYFIFINGSVFNKTKAMGEHLKVIKQEPENALFIGDMEHDIEAAHKHGLLSGAVVNGYHSLENLVRHKPRFVWNHQTDWVPFFRELFRELTPKPARDYPVSTVGALVLNKQGEALFVLTHKWGFTYGIPGGKIDKGETAYKALVREFMEETGLDIKAELDPILVMDCINSDEFYQKDAHFVLLNYIATTKSTNVVLNDESVSYLWLKPKQALNLHLNQPTRQLVETYLAKK